MTVEQVLREIEALPPEDQVKVFSFARHLEAQRRLTGPELTALADKLARSADVVETAALRDQITTGFYGGNPNA